MPAVGGRDGARASPFFWGRGHQQNVVNSDNQTLKVRLAPANHPCVCFDTAMHIFYTAADFSSILNVYVQ